jgi:putative SOS response-associated peptidase YedK
MCYHTKSPTQAEQRAFVGNGVTVVPFPELEFANGFNGPELPVMLNTERDKVQPWRWNFTIPGGVLDPRMTTLNCKSETMFESRLFGESARERRCLVFLKGFYEWTPVEGSKVKVPPKKPYYIYHPHGDLIVAAGIWKDWGLYDGQPYRCLSLATTDANEFMQQVRPKDAQRQLFMLERSEWDAWLDPSATVEELKRFIHVSQVPLEKTLLPVSPLAKKKPEAPAEPRNLF